MKDLIHQFYNEGLAKTFYKKPKEYIDKYIKNKILNKILSTLIIIIYTILILAFAGFIFYKKIK